MLQNYIVYTTKKNMINSGIGPLWPSYFPYQQICFPSQLLVSPQVYTFVQAQGYAQTRTELAGSEQKQQSFGAVEPANFSGLSEDDDSSQSKSYRPRRKAQKPQKKPKKKFKIKPERNALTNIGNQILTFIYLKKKNQQIIQNCFPNLKTEELYGYYTFAKQVKLSMYGYINYEKLSTLWHRNEKKGEQALNFQILRTLSLYYVRDILVRSILTSRKMPSDVKPVHLRVRRKLLSFLAGNR